MTQRFHLGDLLSVSTGVLLSPIGVEGVYKILSFMTADDVFTHQIPRAIDECQPEILRQHPFLASVSVPEFDGEQAVRDWLKIAVSKHGEWFQVSRLAGDDHARRDPAEELAEMMGTERMIVVSGDAGAGGQP